ncbi:MAG: serine/threonine protein kinase [Peptococcaceae bacterium]|nr:serine/threonine protein kinase [Peptococcaceae bacterium]
MDTPAPYSAKSGNPAKDAVNKTRPLKTLTQEEEMRLANLRKYEPLWDAWHIDSLLGKGSYGEVYRAHRDAFGKTHYSAVKIISIPSHESEIRQMRKEGYDDASLRRFFQALLMDLVSEIELMNELRGNSHIVSFEDHKAIEKADGIGWDLLIRMELLTNLSDYAALHPLDLAEVTKLGIHICKALELCAQKNIIHRDIKPDNIFISQYGSYKLGDFGVARKLEHTMSGLSLKGTSSYMAPEVCRGQTYGASVDTYSLGIVMYYFLNRGRTPFLPDFPQIVMPKDREAALQRRMSGADIPALKNVSPAFNALVLKACAYNRDERFASPSEMREALERTLRTPEYESVKEPYYPDLHMTRQTDKPSPKISSKSSKKVLLIVAGLSAVALLVLGVWLFSGLFSSATDLTENGNGENHTLNSDENNENAKTVTQDPQGNKYNKHAVTAEQFKETLQEMGYSVTTDTNWNLLSSLTEDVSKAYRIVSGDLDIHFLEFKTAANSVSYFNLTKSFTQDKNSSSLETNESDENYQKYTLTQTPAKQYYVYVQLDNTGLFVECNESNSAKADAIVEKLGY